MKGHCGAVSKPINIHERGCDRGARTDHCYCPWARPSLMNIHKVHKTGMFWFRRSGGQNAAGTELSMGGGGSCRPWGTTAGVAAVLGVQ